MLTIDGTRTALTHRYGPPTASRGGYVTAFTCADGRAIALENQGQSIRLWFENDPRPDPLPLGGAELYPPGRGRSSNLPGRLSHEPPTALRQQGFPKAVLKVTITSNDELVALLDWYDGYGHGLDRAALDALKNTFLARYPDFKNLTFVASSGSYWDEVRSDNQQLIEQARVAITRTPPLLDTELGQAFLDILVTNPASRLLGSVPNLVKLRRTHRDVVETASGKLIRSELSAPAAIGAFIDEIWPLCAAGNEKSRPFEEIRTFPTLVLALAKPDAAIAVRYWHMREAGKRLLNRSLLAKAPLSAVEYADVLKLANALRSIMRDEWHWQPRDLWDVQGFIWATFNEPSSEQIDGEQTNMATVAPQSPLPTNLILYGPPGTGKTFATTRRAVELCDGKAPQDHEALKRRYEELRERKRIEFVTFHQSFSYEEFVEGLRPETGAEAEGEDGAAAGFRLVTKAGVFRRIAERAAANRGAKQGNAFIVTGRQAFKMSLGKAANPEEAYLFDECIEKEYVLLGYGGDIDWSDPKYEDFDAIRDRWRQDYPNATGKDPNIRQIYALRSSLEDGDLVIVSNGNSRFRAIGEVTGPYRFVQREQGDYFHQRPVRWLWSNRDEGLPREDIYAKQFSMVSIYCLVPTQVNWPTLQQVVDGAVETGDATPEPYVLIIDEINRANVSKVFGELITLLEPDKRLGQPNAISVTLPYSGQAFSVPSNLHIIGTMNTADRSIALLDTALRRRFTFEELMPNPGVLEAVDGIDLGAILTAMNDRIEFLFDRDHQIGHAYFMGCRNRADVEAVMRRKVIPLLVEFFHENWEKVRAVLNESEDRGAFIVRTRLTPPAALIRDDGDAAERWRYIVNPAFSSDAFRQLLG